MVDLKQLRTDICDQVRDDKFFKLLLRMLDLIGGLEEENNKLKAKIQDLEEKTTVAAQKKSRRIK